ncbi:MAG: amidohydrolase family protein [Bryobacterales bacterium]|jgi:imidazolonepropionase-like amidohydrolase|nr:amidohydrolase family protein [Bryobacterales bacterium]
MLLAIAAIVITGARLIDGGGGPPVEDSIVVIEGDRIVAAGSRASVNPPAGEVFDARGLTLLPGLIDAHYHRGNVKLPNTFLNNGVTSVRDPGAWNQSYEPVKQLGLPIPRLFLTGPHLDMAPAAYPRNSILVNDPEEARAVVHRFADEGATALKVYYRLPLATIRAVCEAAHQRNIPVTAHLEIVRADDAIEAGLDGIEHVTSVGTAIADPMEAESFRQAVTASNEARNEGRYQLWSKIDLESPRVSRLIDLMVRRGVFFSPNLAIFERRAGERGATEMHAKACENMRRFTGLASKAGVRVVVGSHSNVPFAETGWAYHREMELMHESGMTPMQVIVGATLDNARFFRAHARIGSIEPGKLADLILIEGDVLRDIRSIRRVRRVMLNGVWIR